eukprot:1011045-Prymnesium_polylepis.1
MCIQSFGRAHSPTSAFAEEVVAAGLLRGVEGGAELVDARPMVLRVAAEGDVERLEEAVHARLHGLGRGGGAGDGRGSLVDHDAIGEVCGHQEVVLNTKGPLARPRDEALDDLDRGDALLAVEVRRGLVNQVEVRRLAQRGDEGDPLQLPPR